MKIIATLVMALFIIGCTPQDTCIGTTESAMQGEEIRLRAQAYIEMCQRKPKSVLCTTELDDE
jgi:hypothetical protein